MKKKQKKLRRKRVRAIQKKRTKENLAYKKAKLQRRALEELKEKMRPTSDTSIKAPEKPEALKVIVVGNNLSPSALSFLNLTDALKVNGLIPVELEAQPEENKIKDIANMIFLENKKGRA
ncbi:MAG TPA: hypothetical protein P5089_02380 [Candidatus Portnoybacteria bacterium]|nr:hypothetical protein [Candidatus Portnoybacteria bacterium]